jgi:hypothetical protein
MLKLIFGLFWTALCVTIALIPEIIMYNVWHLIEPTTTIEKILVMALFWMGGGGLCILFAVLGIGLWGAMMKELLR